MSNGYNVFPANKSLFRAKRKDNNDWIYWNIYGELCRVSGKRTRLAITKGADTSYYDYIHQIRHLLIPETIGRFIGSIDIKGKKFFEGDFVKGKFKINRSLQLFKVELSLDGIFVFNNNHVEVSFEEISQPQIIGNIYDNPELMEKWKYG